MDTSESVFYKYWYDVSHEVWAAAQLMPNEGIEDGVYRIYEILKRERIASEKPE